MTELFLTIYYNYWLLCAGDTLFYYMLLPYSPTPDKALSLINIHFASKRKDLQEIYTLLLFIVNMFPFKRFNLNQLSLGLGPDLIMTRHFAFHQHNRPHVLLVQTNKKNLHLYADY